MNLDLTQKTALVCGSSQGIGRATAIELALLGANVVLMARNAARLQTVLAELDTSRSQEHHLAVADFAETDSVARAVAGLLTRHPVIHILINNTGGPAGGPLLEAQPEAFLQTFQAHVLNSQTLVQALAPGMRQAGYGRIVNIISTSVKQPIVGLGVSNTIRGAMAQWGKTLSLELGPWGITVNNVLPGYTQTARLEAVVAMRAQASGQTPEAVAAKLESEIPIGRFATAAEVAAAVAFLCTPAAGSISGINVPVDGGKTGGL